MFGMQFGKLGKLGFQDGVVAPAAPGIFFLLLSGDMQSGTDKLLFSGDEQSGTDRLLLSGDEGS